MKLDQIISSSRDITSEDFIAECKNTLDEAGVLVLKDFIQPDAIEQIKNEGSENITKAYFCANKHTVYLTPQDENLPLDHPRNIEVTSSKGLIGDDQIPENSSLKTLYKSQIFQTFIRKVVGEEGLYPYADPLSSVNLHFAKEGQELGWHFDNSSFAITLLIDKPDGGGDFEYIKDLRDADTGDMNYDGVGNLLSGALKPETLNMEAGTLVLFRGRNSIHRVTPTIGSKTRMLAVLAYNSKPNVELSESARMTFYGRLG